MGSSLQCVGFSSGGALEHVDSAVAALGLSCPAACRILVPWPGTILMSPVLKGGFLTTEPPGKSLYEVLKSHFPVLYILVVLVDASPVTFQSSVFWGLISQVLFKIFYLSFGHATWLAGSLFSAQGSNLGSQQWKHGVLTTGLPGNSLSSQVLLVGVLPVGLKPFTSQVKVLHPHLVAGCRSRGGLYGKVASQPLLPTLVWSLSCLPHV